jgi:hypothetical protein
MTDTPAIRGYFGAAPADDEAPTVSLWKRAEPTVLGVGSIVLLLVLWELTPHLVTISAGTKLFFTTPSKITVALWTMFATGSIWHPLGVSAAGFAIGLGFASACCSGAHARSTPCSIRSSPRSTPRRGWCSCRCSCCGSASA